MVTIAYWSRCTSNVTFTPHSEQQRRDKLTTFCGRQFWFSSDSIACSLVGFGRRTGWKVEWGEAGRSFAPADGRRPSISLTDRRTARVYMPSVANATAALSCRAEMNRHCLVLSPLTRTILVKHDGEARSPPRMTWTPRPHRAAAATRSIPGVGVAVIRPAWPPSVPLTFRNPFSRGLDHERCQTSARAKMNSSNLARHTSCRGHVLALAVRPARLSLLDYFTPAEATTVLRLSLRSHGQL